MIPVGLGQIARRPVRGADMGEDRPGWPFWARIGRGGPLNKDRPGWPRKLKLAGRAVFCSPRDAL